MSEFNPPSVIKGYVIHHLPDWNDLPVMERWFHREHCPDVLMQSPWLTRYEMYRAVNPPPEGAEELGFMNYRVHETFNFGFRAGMNGMPSFRVQPKYMEAAMVNVFAVPDEDFFGAEARAFERPVLRWITLFKYPESISAEEGDDWYLNTHVPEAMNQKGLTRFFSYKVLPGKEKPKEDRHRPFAEFSPLMFVKWNRLSEMWYECGKDWTESVVKNPPKYTKPKWAEYDRYPFFEPWKDFVSTFLLERPTEDLKVTSEKVYY